MEDFAQLKFYFQNTTGWWLQPIWKNISQVGIISPNRDEHKKIFETTNQTKFKSHHQIQPSGIFNQITMMHNNYSIRQLPTALVGRSP